MHLFPCQRGELSCLSVHLQEEGVSIQRARAKKDGLAFSTADKKESAVFKFEASRLLQQQGDQGATKTIETETEFDRDARYSSRAAPGSPL